MMILATFGAVCRYGERKSADVVVVLAVVVAAGVGAAEEYVID